MAITHDTPVRVSVAMENRRQYASFRGMTGRINVFTSSPVGEVAEVIFTLPDGLRTVEAHIPVNHLVAVPAACTEAQKAERKAKIAIPADEGTESEKQAAAVRFLRGLGYRVTVTGKTPEPATCFRCGGKVITCPVHGQPVFSRGAINAAGLGDLLVTHPVRWTKFGPRLMQIEIEYKLDAKAKRKPAQVERAAEGVSVFVWSLVMCLTDITSFERQMGFDVHPEALAYLETQGIHS